jgi:hypothetical protein
MVSLRRIQRLAGPHITTEAVKVFRVQAHRLCISKITLVRKETSGSGPTPWSRRKGMRPQLQWGAGRGQAE